MSTYGSKPMQILANTLLNKINGGTLVFYEGGSIKPEYVGHEMARGVEICASFNLANPAGVYSPLTGNIELDVTTQFASNVNYTIPNFFRLFTPQGEAVYQGDAFAAGRDVRGFGSPEFTMAEGGSFRSQVKLTNKMLDDEYDSYSSFEGVNYDQLPPNYKCDFLRFAIQFR